MSPTTDVPPPPRPYTTSPIRAVATTVVGTAFFLVLVGLASKALHLLFDRDLFASTARGRTLLAISGSALGEWIFFALLLLLLRLQGRSLEDLGLTRRAPLRGWIAAAFFTGLYVWVVFSTALGPHPPLAERSAFHLYGSLAAGLSAGFVEEIFFRGFIMETLHAARVPTALQILASAILFGVAHVGWGLFSKRADPNAAIGAIFATAVLGLFFALVYVTSRRSLMPVVCGHIVMDILIEPWLVLVTVTTAMAHAAL